MEEQNIEGTSCSTCARTAWDHSAPGSLHLVRSYSGLIALNVYYLRQTSLRVTSAYRFMGLILNPIQPTSVAIRIGHFSKLRGKKIPQLEIMLSKKTWLHKPSIPSPDFPFAIDHVMDNRPPRIVWRWPAAYQLLQIPL